LLDNWSIETAAHLIESGLRSILQASAPSHVHEAEDLIIANSLTESGEARLTDREIAIGALSNLVTALVLFDEISYLENGWESGWQQFTDYAGTLASDLTPIKCSSEGPDVQFERDMLTGGISYYCNMAQYHQTDLLLNPLRSENLLSQLPAARQTHGSCAVDLLKELDASVKRVLQSTPSILSGLTALPDFTIPSITSLVLKRAKSRAHILEEALRLRSDPGVRDLRKAISELAHGQHATTAYLHLVDDARDAVEFLAYPSKRRKKQKLSVGLSWLIVGVSFGVDQLERPRNRYALFLRDLASCRLEQNADAFDVENLLQ